MDVTEKSAQVMRMTEIYSRAKHVRVWLGIADRTSDDAILYLRELLSKDLIKVTRRDYMGIDSLDMLLRRAWFRRKWVIQEIAIARDVSIYCGTECLPWKDFADSFVTFTRLLRTESSISYIGEDFSRTGANTLVYVSNNIFQRDSRGEHVIHWLVSIEALLQRLSQFEATDPRDVVYAVLALAKNTYASSLIPVDYSKPVWEVYRDVIAVIVCQSQSLDIICRPRAATANLTWRPSWMQSHRRASFRIDEKGGVARKNADTLVGETGRSPYRACGSSTAIATSFDFVNHRQASNVILAEGFIIDEIGTCGTVAFNGSIPLNWFEIGGWSSTKSHPPQTFCRTLVANRDDKGDNPPAWYPRICHRVFMNAGSSSTRYSPKDLERGSKDAPMALEFIKRLHATIWNRRFGKTAINQAPGLFPAGAQIGDLIRVLYGCSVPVVMRKKQDLSTAQLNYLIEPDMDWKRPEPLLGVNIEPYITKLRSIYAKQGANWDDGMEKDNIIFAAEDTNKKILDSYQKSPPRRKNTDIKKAAEENGSNISAGKALSYEKERLAKIDFECTLIGECFMYGVMDGEAMELTRSGGVEPIMFGIW